MKINNIHITNIRNHTETSLELCDFLNIFCGLNGAGKTSILEAISIAGLSKSFLPVTDSVILNHNSESYSIRLDAKNDLSLPYFVSIDYRKSEPKVISNTYGDNLLSKDIIGKLPIVVLSPDLKEITFGSPQCRRTLMDRILSQSFALYLDNWIKLKKILRNRSILLSSNLKNRDLDFDSLQVLTNILVQVSAEIIFRRAQFVKIFSEKFTQYYSDISKSKEEVSLKYRAFDIKDTSSKELIIQQLKATSEKYYEDEIRRGVTLFGPQRDDLKIIINGGVARDYASQGQHKSLLIALKFAEFFFIKETLNETPVVILDDIFSELDMERTAAVIDLVKSHNAQTFISINQPDFMDKIHVDGNFKIFNISDGKAEL